MERMTLAIALAMGAGMGAAALLTMSVLKATASFLSGVYLGLYMRFRDRLPPQIQRKTDADLGLAHDVRLPMPIMPAIDYEAENRAHQRRHVWEKVFLETVVDVAGRSAGRASEDALLAAATTAHAAIDVWEQFHEYERDRARQSFPAAPVAVQGGAP